jgi:Flp pilus assembly protein TadB
MPLSEDEQRILRQIEQELEQDPTFAERGVRVSRRRLVLGVVGTVVALFVTVVALAVSFVVSFVAFAVALTLAAVVVGELRLIGRERLGDSPLSAWIAAARSQRPG